MNSIETTLHLNDHTFHVSGKVRNIIKINWEFDSCKM